MKSALRSLFLTDNEATETKPKEVKSSNEGTSFPSSSPQTSSNLFGNQTTPNVATSGLQAINQEMCEPHLNTFLEMYEKGFNSLNQEGYDFFEFFQAIVEAGMDNAQVYNMGMTMAKAMDKSISKDRLISQSQHYINELTKVHENYVKSGNNKKVELTSQKDLENRHLQQELEALKIQRDEINRQINTCETKLSQIDSKYQPQITEVECKLMANNFAKDKLLSAITTVVNGIKTNIK